MSECNDFRRGAMIPIRYMNACDTIRATRLRLFQFLFSSSKDAKGAKTKKKPDSLER